MTKYIIYFRNHTRDLEQTIEASSPEEAVGQIRRSFGKVEIGAVTELREMDISNMHETHNCGKFDKSYYRVMKSTLSWRLDFTKEGTGVYIKYCPFCGEKL